MPGFWDRLRRRGDQAAEERVAEEEQMSADERRFVEEPVEGHAADSMAEKRLGGFNPNDLIDN